MVIRDNVTSLAVLGKKNDWSRDIYGSYRCILSITYPFN